tara:strand:- start:73 stop:765 length:693 start_codon:yes stop_codon:yes gene_type:complete
MDNFDLRKYLTENQLTHSSIKLNEVSIDMLQTQFVDTGRIDRNTFKDIVDAAQNDSAFATWLTSRVAGTKKAKPIIKKEDISKYKKHLETFKRNKREYPLKDINMVKDQNALDDFIKKSREIQAREEEDISQQKGVSKAEKYTKLKLGEVDGYEIFKFPKGSKELYGASCELGSGTDWCTATGNTDSFFQDYISKGDIYIITSKSNPKEKYQFHYETDSFMDSDDLAIFG